MLKKITVNEMKLIQLDMLRYIHSFCIKNDIKYTLIFGTLLGAVRHKGYIPWDDDIDIAMPRSDYEMFVKSFSHDFYKVYDYRMDLEYANPYAKIADTRTILEENINMKSIGINIDLFPLDNLFNSKEESLIFVNSLNCFKKRFRMKLLKPSNKNVWWKRMAINISKLFVLNTTLKEITEKEYKRIETLNNDNSTYVGFPVDPEIGAAARSICERSVFDNYTLIEFEKEHFMVISGYDQWLSQIYGDYMTPPPMAERTSPHSLSNIYWI